MKIQLLSFAVLLIFYSCGTLNLSEKSTKTIQLDSNSIIIPDHSRLDYCLITGDKQEGYCVGNTNQYIKFNPPEADVLLVYNTLDESLWPEESYALVNPNFFKENEVDFSLSPLSFKKEMVKSLGEMLEKQLPKINDLIEENVNDWFKEGAKDEILRDLKNYDIGEPIVFESYTWEENEEKNNCLAYSIITFQPVNDSRAEENEELEDYIDIMTYALIGNNILLFQARKKYNNEEDLNTIKQTHNSLIKDFIDLN